MAIVLLALSYWEKEMKITKKLQVAADQPEVFENIANDMLLQTEDEDAGEVMILTRQSLNDPEEVELLLVFPTVVNQDEGVPVKYQPTGIAFSLATFLNTARTLAVHHQSYLKKVGKAEPEAQTHEQAGQILLDPSRRA